MLRPIYDNIPQELKDAPQWVNWESIERDGKKTKPPYQPNGKLAESNNQATWSSFSIVKEAEPRFDGVGFVLTNNDSFVGLDFDKCRCPAFDGIDHDISGGLNMVLPAVADHLRDLNAYTEISPSGKGIRVLLKGKLPQDGKRKGDIEAYQSGRYVTLTGHVLAGFPLTIEHRQEALDGFFDTVFGNSGKHTERETKLHAISYLDGWRDLIEEAFKRKSGTQLKRLWDGDHSDYPSQSEADLALCGQLAFLLNGDPAVIDAAFRASGLMRDKWDERHYSDGRTYGDATISKVIANCQSFYKDLSPEGCEKQIKQGAPSVSWPDPLDDAAYYGLAGEWVRRVLPNTEADPAALLFQFLVSFGNVVGRNPHFLVEATKHYTNEFLLLVGTTSKGRKGTSWDHVLYFLALIDSFWNLECIKSGLTSGEGLIYHVRDSRVDMKGKLADEGVDDKRLVAYESEFANILKIIERKDNTLSATMRDAWDRGHLRTLAKNSPVKATGAHISIISHITKAELRARLSETESFNGFANRFLFACVQRSKLLPEGGGTVDLSGIIPRLQRAVKFSQSVGQLHRDEEARAIWCDTYGYLTRDQSGILGSVLARDAAHVVRLSMIYALLDCSNLIRQEHLLAALACWEYVEASARFIFDSMTGDPMADRIYEAAWQTGSVGITQTFIYSTLFQRNKSGERIDQAIEVLKTMGKVRVETIETQGRPETRIFIAHLGQQCAP